MPTPRHDSPARLQPFVVAAGRDDPLDPGLHRRLPLYDIWVKLSGSGGALCSHVRRDAGRARGPRRAGDRSPHAGDVLVPARWLAPSARQHALSVDLRRQRRRPDGPWRLSDLLPAGRRRFSPDTRVCQPGVDASAHRRQRRHRGRAGCLLGPLSPCAYSIAGLHWFLFHHGRDSGNRVPPAVVSYAVFLWTGIHRDRRGGGRLGGAPRRRPRRPGTRFYLLPPPPTFRGMILSENLETAEGRTQNAESRIHRLGRTVGSLR